MGLGAGGHAKGVIEILRQTGGYDIVGLLDANPGLWQSEVMNIPVLGGDDLLPHLYAQGIRHAFIGVGGVGDTRPREELYRRVRAMGFEVAAVVHPSAVIAQSARIGHGPTIMAQAVINADAVMGEDVIINTGAIVEHDCVIGDHVHVATGARLASTVSVGDGSHVGVGASIRQGVRVGRRAIVGAGAAVVEDVPDGVVVVGVPARALRRRDEP